MVSEISIRRKYWFGSLVLLAAAIAGLIGPSSAILIIPQLEWWPLSDGFSGTDGFSWVDVPYESIWPSEVNASITESCAPLVLARGRGCPCISMIDIQDWTADYQTQWSLPNITIKADGGALNYLTASDGDQRTNGYSVASTGMSFLSRAMGTMWLYGQNATMKYAKVGRPLITLISDDDRPLLKPLVQVQCAQSYDISHADQVNVTFNTSSLLFKEGEGARSLSRIIDTKPYRPENKTIRFNWTNLSTDSKSIALGALFSMSITPTSQLSSSNQGNLTRALYPCVVKPYWAPTTMSRDPTTDNDITLNNPDPYEAIKNANLMKLAREINIDFSFAENLNADFGPPYYFQNVLEFELSHLSYQYPFFNGAWHDRWPWLIASVISMQLADALSRISHAHTIYVWHQSTSSSPGNYAKDISNLNSLSSTIDLPSKYPDQILANASSYFPVRWKIERFGYAWGFERSTKVLASVVLLAHVFLIVIHYGIVLTKRRQFQGWGKLVEFLTLVLQSPPALKSIEKTSPEIREESRLSARQVCIRESEDGKSAVLVMSDGSQEGKEVRKRLVIGKSYA